MITALKKHQTPLDFVTQHGGDLEGLFEMAALNGMSITKDVVPGTQLEVAEAELKTIRFYKRSGLDIKTNYLLMSGGYVKPGGIGYMQIENDFIVT
jgi:hypothetical protein